MKKNKSKYGLAKWLVLGLLNCITLALAILYFYKKKTIKDLKVVDSVDLEKYSGKWYEIASIPEKDKENYSNITVEYIKTNDNSIKVINTCNKDFIDEIEEKVERKVYPVKGSNNAKLKVEFEWPFKRDYWIIDIDKDYKYVMIGEPERKYLFILSRSIYLDQDIYDSLIKKAESQDFDINKLKKTGHYRTKKSMRIVY